MKEQFDNFLQEMERIPDYHFFGRVTSVKGLLIECSGLEKVTSIGSRCKIILRNSKEVKAEVVGFRSDITLLMPFVDISGIGVGCIVWLEDEDSLIYPHQEWKGRIINAMAQPIDDIEGLPKGSKGYSLKNSPPIASRRNRVEGKIDIGVRSINTFLTCCLGQRMGIFSGSGVGKSVLMSMMAKYCAADVKVIGLIGERGREVQEFIQDYLGEEGLKNSVIIVATSDESALMRRQAAYLTLVVSEFYRDIGQNVLCMIDSVTRFAMSQREIGLSAGEPPTTKGYTPTVFSELPKLLERAGPGESSGSITGFFNVLVEGDDHNEPIADMARGILDGHIVLDRKIAERGRFPAVNIIKSISRTMPACNSSEENELINKAKSFISTYEDMEELIRLGAYKRGSDPKVDAAIKYIDKIEDFIRQNPNESSNIQEGYAKLTEILSS